MDISWLIALGALLIAVATLGMKLLDKSLTLREHAEFKESVKAQLQRITERQDVRLEIVEFDKWRDQVNRDFNRIEQDLRVIDATKPSAETLEEAMKAVDARVTHLEEMVRELRKNS